MIQPTFHYCYFSFTADNDKHDLRVRVTPSLGLEWHLYINDMEIGYFIDERTNTLLQTDLTRALSYANVLTVYNDLLTGA